MSQSPNTTHSEVEEAASLAPSHGDTGCDTGQNTFSRRQVLRLGMMGLGAMTVGGWSEWALAQGANTPSGNALAHGALATSNFNSSAMHPKVYATPEDVKRARENVALHPWAQKLARGIRDAANKWLERDDAWIRGVVPGPDACYAYGFTGCPICGASWGIWDKVNTSFEMNGHVKCANGHVLPDAEHPDAGQGYRGADGRIHYFVGSYNAWVIEQLTSATTNLAHAYALTGDERYASKASVILDALATVYPTCTKGSWDYPSNPPSGRFHRPWYQVARVLVIYTEQYDHVYHSPSFDEPSLMNGLTRRRNVEENLLKNGAKYCYEESKKEGEGGVVTSAALTNGVADYIRGSMAVGICLDMPEYVRWAVDGPSGILSMLDNNLGRDGTYYETSSLYAGHSRNLYVTFSEPLYLYRGSAYPNGVNLYEHPKFRSFLTLHNSRQTIAGHQPAYGDTAPDTSRLDAPERPTNANDLIYIERLYARTRDEKARGDLGALLNWYAEGDVESQRNSSNDRWMLFHARPVPKVAPAQATLPRRFAESLISSTLLGQKGLAILRAGSDFSPAGQQGVALRYGPSLNHGHYDDLNINFISHGYEMTYDIGYGLGSTHTQVGWAKQTASHNLVMVDETAQGHDNPSGGSLHLFADLPHVKLVEADSNGSYASHGVTDYRRTLALIDGYLLDIFRVTGGKQHDYLLHTCGKTLAVEGVPLSAVGSGSLAGPEISWGNHQLNDGDIDGHPNQPYWNPPPGNGYGFLVEPRRGTTDTAWNATWNMDETTAFRCHVPAEAGAQVTTVWAPGITPEKPKMHSIVRRRKATGTEPLRSAFVSALEPYRGQSTVRGIETLHLEPVSKKKTGVEPVAVRIAKTGSFDWVYSSGDAQSHRVQGEVGKGLSFAARFAHLRTETASDPNATQIFSLSLVGAREFEGLGWKVTPEREGWSGKISGVDIARQVLTTKTALPEGEALHGHIVLLNGPHASRNSAYAIERVTRVGNGWEIVLQETSQLGRGIVQKVKDATTLVSLVPHEYGRKLGGGNTCFFDGKRIQNANGTVTHIKSIAPGPPFELTVESTKGFAEGDTFHYHDVEAGDSFQIFAATSIERVAPNSYRYQSLIPVRIKAPKGVKVEKA